MKGNYSQAKMSKYHSNIEISCNVFMHKTENYMKNISSIKAFNLAKKWKLSNSREKISWF